MISKNVFEIVFTDAVSLHETLLNDFDEKNGEIELQNQTSSCRNDLGISAERTENIFSNENNKNKNYLESSLALQNNSIDETERIPTPVLSSNMYKLQVNNLGN